MLPYYFHILAFSSFHSHTISRFLKGRGGRGFYVAQMCDTQYTRTLSVISHY